MTKIIIDVETNEIIARVEHDLIEAEEVIIREKRYTVVLKVAKYDQITFDDKDAPDDLFRLDELCFYVRSKE